MRCYEVDITFHYQIDGGLTNSTTTTTKVQFSSLFQQVPGLLSLHPGCSGVVVTRKDILSSPPGVKSIFFTIPMIFTASTNVADGQISTKIVACISTLTASYKGFIDSNTPSISQNGTHTTYNTSTISEKQSCCGGSIPPPCCTVGSVNVSSSKCGCLPGFHFFPGSLCQRCPSDTYQDEQGQSSCKKCPGRKQTFGKTGMTSNSSCLDPPLIGNYDVKRCYVLDVIFNYRIPGGLTVNTTRNVIGEFQSLFLVVHNLFLSLQQCKEVIVTIGNIASSPPGVSLVYFRVPLTFTASNNIADDQVAINVTTCVNAANVSLKGYIDRSAPNITQNKTTYQINQQSSLEKKSCCGGDIPPPCCAVGSIKVSNTSCGCLPGFHHVTGRSCVPCPSDTYQDEQGQKSCKTCPANTVTFGKTRMTHKANCTGCLPGFHFVTGRSCVSCPSDTYQDEHGQISCKTCPVNTGTFGKTRMTNQANCTDTNPLQVNDQVVFLPKNINNETIVASVTVTAVLASLARPFKFYIDNVTQPRLLSREVSRRKRRRIEVDSQCTHPELCPQMLVDLCLKAGAIKPENYFCIHRFTGRIRVTQDFVFKEGEVFDLQIRVTDSDPRGITVNTAKVKLISGDPCRNVLAIYDEAVKYCIKNSESVDGRKKCLSTQCTLTAHDWKEALNNASKVPEKDCSADPHNLTVLIRENPLCAVYQLVNAEVFPVVTSLNRQALLQVQFV
ncbi:uncharacterized protein [Pocillopora verrucosa]|uniref:uncharacterized protein n=1 Tax=Pocillopora verrucosa TaxID=203993 RepID=UPI003340DD6E